MRLSRWVLGYDGREEEQLASIQEQGGEGQYRVVGGGDEERTQVSRLDEVWDNGMGEGGDELELVFGCGHLRS